MSSSVSNTLASILEWIMKIIVLGILIWLLTIGLKSFDNATFHKIFVGFTYQINDKTPHRLENTRSRLDSTFYTNQVFYVDMTLGNDIKNNPPVDDIHQELKQFFESSVTGPKKFGVTMKRYQVKTTYRFVDAEGSPLSDETIPHSQF